jgi:hypothetical protein
MFNSFKFKTTRHLMLNGALPPKGLLISICKVQLKFDYTALQKKLTRLVSLKDRIVMAIFIFSKMGHTPDILTAFTSLLDDRPTLAQEMAQYCAE